jgi:hypothetical protein
LVLISSLDSIQDFLRHPALINTVCSISMFTVISEVSALTDRRTLPQCILSFSFLLQMGSVTVLDFDSYVSQQ